MKDLPQAGPNRDKGVDVGTTRDLDVNESDADVGSMEAAEGVGGPDSRTEAMRGTSA